MCVCSLVNPSVFTAVFTDLMIVMWCSTSYVVIDYFLLWKAPQCKECKVYFGYTKVMTPHDAS